MIQTFTSIRKATIVCLIAATAVFALLAVLGIWEVTDRQTLSRSFSSLVVIAVTSSLVIIASLVGEGKNAALFSGRGSGARSPLAVVLTVIVVLMLLSWLLGGLRSFF